MVKKKIVLLMVVFTILAVIFIGCGKKQTSTQVDLNTELPAAEIAEEESDEYVPPAKAYTEEEWAKIEGEDDVGSRIILPQNIEVGSSIFLGTYEQDNNPANGEEEIEWIVLAKEEDRILVVSKYGLDSQEYNNSSANITWEISPLRKWLNEDFFYNAFSSDEQAVIATSSVSAEKNPEYDTISGNVTQDKVFLLSIAEAEGFFGSSDERQCEPTVYAKEHKTNTGDNGCAFWWLRTSGRYQVSVAYVNSNGGVEYEGADGLYNWIAVRPAMQIVLDTENTAPREIPVGNAEAKDKFTEPSTEKFVYSYDAVLGGMIITGYNGEDRLIRIPAELDGDPVKQVNLEFCNKIAQIEIPDGVVSIRFSKCSNLEKIVIPNSITSIDNFAFNECVKLKEIIVPDSVTSIGEYAFYQCTSLTEVKIPDSVASIDSDAFRGCTSLTKMEIPDNVTSIGYGAFSDCTGLTKIDIPGGVAMNGGAFSGCTSFTEIIIPSGITNIPEYTFNNCTSLTKIEIPDSVTSIERNAFSGCTALRNLTIPNSVEEIESDAFEDCNGLTVTYQGQEYNYASDTHWW